MTIVAVDSLIVSNSTSLILYMKSTPGVHRNKKIKTNFYWQKIYSLYIIIIRPKLKHSVNCFQQICKYREHSLADEDPTIFQRDFVLTV